MMKKYAWLILFFETVQCVLFAQTQYEILKHEKHAYGKWYNSSQNYYNPDTATLNAFERVKGKVQFVVFGGTWCEDTQFILPKFFKLQEKTGVPDNTITFFGVNRAKKSLGSISEAFNVTLVPTIIVMKDGKEIGRVVEYGKTGKWDKELATVLNQ